MATSLNANCNANFLGTNLIQLPFTDGSRWNPIQIPREKDGENGTIHHPTCLGWSHLGSHAKEVKGWTRFQLTLTMSTKSHTIASNNYLKDLYLKQRLSGDFTLSRICCACFGKNEAHWAMITSIETCKKTNIKFSRTWIKKKKKKFLVLFPYEF